MVLFWHENHFFGTRLRLVYLWNQYKDSLDQQKLVCEAGQLGFSDEAGWLEDSCLLSVLWKHQHTTDSKPNHSIGHRLLWSFQQGEAEQTAILLNSIWSSIQLNYPKAVSWSNMVQYALQKLCQNILKGMFPLRDDVTLLISTHLSCLPLQL